MSKLCSVRYISETDFVAIAAVAFVYGVGFGHYDWPPAGIVRALLHPQPTPLADDGNYQSQGSCWLDHRQRPTWLCSVIRSPISVTGFTTPRILCYKSRIIAGDNSAAILASASVKLPRASHASYVC